MDFVIFSGQKLLKIQTELLKKLRFILIAYFTRSQVICFHQKNDTIV